MFLMFLSSSSDIAFMRKSANLHWVLPFVVAAAAIAANAQSTLDPSAEEALKKTMELLNNTSLRQEALDNPNAKRADKAVSTVSGGDPAVRNDIYALSSIIFEKITKESGGDTSKMNQLMLEAQRNPASFAEKYFPAGSPEAAKLSELAGKAAAKSPVLHGP